MILPLNERQFLIGKLEGIEQQFMAEAQRKAARTELMRQSLN